MLQLEMAEPVLTFISEMVMAGMDMTMAEMPGDFILEEPQAHMLSWEQMVEKAEAKEKAEAAENGYKEAHPDSINLS